jgi:hypothetical protein
MQALCTKVVMDKLSLKYELDDDGWATITLANSSESVSRPVSYLHDSLLDLVQMAIDLKGGKKESVAIFMDEPGEYQLVIQTLESHVSYEFRQYQDWESWGMWPKEDFTLLLSGQTKLESCVAQIIDIASFIYKNIGPTKYKDMWVEHEFPSEEFHRLINA